MGRSNSLQAIPNFLFLIGEGAQLGFEAMCFMVRGRLRLGETFQQVCLIANNSLPMVLLLASIGGGVLAMQSAQKFAQTGADAYVGGLVSLAIVREIAPMFTAMAVGARAGTAMASQLAHMKVNNQIDALHMLHVRPARYLVQPRLLASLVSLPILTLVAEAAAIGFGMLVAKAMTGLNFALYLESVWLTLRPYDIWVSLIKAIVFGLLLALTCCSIGLSAEGGSKQVGLSAMQAAVWTAILVVMTDFAMSWFFFTGKALF